MAHLVGRLTALKVAKVKKPGMYADGAGLYLQVSGDGESTLAKSWIFRFTLRGRSREMGLGSLSLFGLAEARSKADHEQFRVDRVHKSFGKIPNPFRPCAAAIFQDVIRKELCTLFIGSLGMGDRCLSIFVAS